MTLPNRDELAGRLEAQVERIFANPDRRMDAYYYGFEPTGVREVDAILSAVAEAGKAYHHTESWTDESAVRPSVADVIQAVANRAAAALRQSPSVEEVADLRRRRDELLATANRYLERARAAETRAVDPAKVRRLLRALDRIMPSDAAAPHASREWREAKAAYDALAEVRDG